MAPGLTISLAPSSASTPPSQPSPPRQANGKKRPHASLGDDSDSDGGPSKQVVTHFVKSGAVNASAPKQEKGPLVIQPQANRDWRDASKRVDKRAKHGLPEEKSSREKEEEIRRIEGGKKTAWGLNVKTGDEKAEDDGEDKEVQGNGHGEEERETRPKTDDERAMDALMGVKQTGDLMIPAANKEDAFKRDYKTAPPMATLDEYAAVPVEQFGAALLRGMGWKEGYGIGNQKAKKLEKTKMIEKRSALLGIGAKEDAAVKEEMGAWGKGARRSDQVYNPIVMRNKKTGEELTEAELRERVAEQEIRQTEADLDALAAKRKEEDRERRRKEERRRKDADSEEEYERRRKEKRRERERGEDKYDRRERRRSRDRGEGRRDRDRDERRERDRRSDRGERDQRDRHRYDRKDDRYEDDKRRRY
ncbi:hypothetical protein CAC42_3151 [Sphaceloma murrayae]|uniref:Pre-mRNA-splicing factor n=1 Tax=Sphaceloma murrayae TaxID=2082308 RepID=A0A2K1QRN8_9PEZI|nr:hypothetical protein CAC42_3151 [Sphaceloma murrayae]